MAEQIKVLELRLFPFCKKFVRAFADVQIGGLILKDFRVMQINGGKPYVKAPFTTYKDKTGQLRFRQIIDLPSEVRGQVDNAILHAFYQREKEQNHARTNTKII